MRFDNPPVVRKGPVGYIVTYCPNCRQGKCRQDSRRCTRCGAEFGKPTKKQYRRWAILGAGWKSLEALGCPSDFCAPDDAEADPMEYFDLNSAYFEEFGSLKTSPRSDACAEVGRG